MNNRQFDTVRHVENYVETVSILHVSAWKHQAAADPTCGEKGVSRRRKTRMAERMRKTAEAAEKRLIPFGGAERRAAEGRSR